MHVKSYLKKAKHQNINKQESSSGTVTIAREVCGNVDVGDDGTYGPDQCHTYYTWIYIEEPIDDSGGGGGGEDGSCTFGCVGGGGVNNAAEIIIDPSFENNPCLSSVYGQAGQAPSYNNILKNFDGEFTVANLIFSTGVDASFPNANAYTYEPINFNIEIKFNPNNLERPPLDIARTLIHELIHAEMYRKLLSIANQPDLRYADYTEQEWRDFINGLRNNFEGLYDYYLRFEWNVPEGQEPSSAQHEAMAQHYREIIEEGMREFDGSFSDDVYEALAWSGLIGTGDLDFSTGLTDKPLKAWEQKTEQERLNIINKILNFKANNSPCQ